MNITSSPPRAAARPFSTTSTHWSAQGHADRFDTAQDMVAHVYIPSRGLPAAKVTETTYLKNNPWATGAGALVGGAGYGAFGAAVGCIIGFPALMLDQTSPAPVIELFAGCAALYGAIKGGIKAHPGFTWESSDTGSLQARQQQDGSKVAYFLPDQDPAHPLLIGPYKG